MERRINLFVTVIFIGQGTCMSFTLLWNNLHFLQIRTLEALTS